MRCYKCQQYNHLQGRCSHPVKCGVYSQTHETEEYIRRRKGQKATTAQGVKLAWTNSYQYLGEWIDRSLTFTTQVTYLRERTQRGSKVLRA